MRTVRLTSPVEQWAGWRQGSLRCQGTWVSHLGRPEGGIAGPSPQGQSEEGGNEDGETQGAAEAWPAQATRSPELRV